MTIDERAKQIAINAGFDPKHPDFEGHGDIAPVWHSYRNDATHELQEEERMRVSISMQNFMQEVEEQIYFARRKFPGREAMVCALTEEVGELARAMLQENHSVIFLEAVQVATMAFRCIYDGDESTDNFRMRRGLPITGEATRPQTLPPFPASKV